jgi:hypothetical protein
MLMNDGRRQPQAYAGPFEVLGGEKGLEDATHVFRRDAHASVGDGDSDGRLIATRVHSAVRCTNVDLSAGEGGVDRIAHKVGKDLTELRGKTSYQVGSIPIGADLQMALDKRAVVEREHVFNDVRDANLNGRRRLAIKGQNLPGDAGDALKLMRCGFNKAEGDLRLVKRTAQQIQQIG